MAFKKGTSGNPGGRPVAAEEVRALAQSHGTRAIERLKFWMETTDGPNSIAACREILNRGYGRAPQAITGADGGPVQLSGDAELLALLERLGHGGDGADGA